MPRSTHINVRLSRSERKQVEDKARRFDMAPSAFMRRAALLAGEKPVRVADAEELRRIHVDLKRIGNNLNQSTMELHAHGCDGIAASSVAHAARLVSEAVAPLASLLAAARG